MSNAVTITRAGPATLTGLVLVALSASLANATYQPRRIFGNNYQQQSNTISANPSSAKFPCTGITDCYLWFQIVSNEKALIVQHVSCLAYAVGSPKFGEIISRNGNGTYTFTYLTPVNTNGSTWVVSSPVKHLVLPKERPLIFLRSTDYTNWSIDCTISGQLEKS